MKKWILSLWLLIPALVLAYHYGPGQRGLMIDEASLMVAAANHYTLEKDWPKTIELCEKILETLPEDEMIYAIRGSASIPMFFEPVELNGHMLADGGLFANLNV